MNVTTSTASTTTTTMGPVITNTGNIDIYSHDWVNTPTIYPDCPTSHNNDGTVEPWETVESEWIPAPSNGFANLLNQATADQVCAAIRATADQVCGAIRGGQMSFDTSRSLIPPTFGVNCSLVDGDGLCIEADVKFCCFATDPTTTSATASTTSQAATSTTAVSSTTVGGGAREVAYAKYDMIPGSLEFCSDFDNHFSSSQPAQKWEDVIGKSRTFKNDLTPVADAWFSDDSSSWPCFSTVISDRAVITTAQCCNYAKEVRVSFGPYYFDLVSSKMVIHPAYLRSRKINDVCLIKFDKSISEESFKHCDSRCVGQACLPTAPIDGGEKVYDVGFFNDALLSSQLTVRSARWCDKKTWLYKNQQCYAKMEDDNGAVCKTEHGSPVFQSKNGRLELAGLFTRDEFDTCYEEGNVGVLTGMLPIRDWIENELLH
ncbi:Oidioi.mRNA.OKI2018_I69.XSR.g13334.t1.cds [Oikopleura dioica]|uniref:Oidioi.mRNA.OKI2018_I69.XSR.g13334.t1.cds n=1 Tax=Oikopleura dioica TaxID=34765 RepID=A0ABN7S6L1_OIKDI|nr:Oidioi.mRNA.OKI2018_I69.XSR.g13334.t1.cds [Oikopleura dioica]